MEKQKKARIEWADIAKGIGILLVLAGHAPRDIMRDTYAWIDFGYYFIYTFHMPFFFFLSGWMFGQGQTVQKTPGQFLSGKIKTLLVPWAVFSALVYFLIQGVNAVPFAKGMLQGTFLEPMGAIEYARQCVSGTNPYCIHLWYLYTLFFIQFFTFLLCWSCRKTRKRPETSRMFQRLLLGAAAVFFIVAPSELPVLTNLSSYMVYFVWGMGMAEVCSFQNRRFLFCLIPGCLICVANVLAVSMKMTGSAAAQTAVYYLCSFAGVPLMILGLCAFAGSLERKARRLKWLGKNSFGIYLLHQPLTCAVLGTVLVRVLPLNAGVCMGIMAVCMAAGVAFPYAAARFAERLGAAKLLQGMLGVKKMEKFPWKT